MKLTITKPLILSFILHTGALGMLLVSMDLTPTPRQFLQSQEQIIDAVTIDNEQILREISAIEELEQQKQQEQARQQRELENKLSELEKKSNVAEEKRKAEEKRLANLKAVQKKEEQRLAQVKKQQEDLEKKRVQEEQKRRDEERARQEALKLAEEKKKRLEAEATLKKRVAEEQNKQDRIVITDHAARIDRSITRAFNIIGLPQGLSCVLLIRMIPGGEVVEAKIDRSSGNAVFDNRAVNATLRASPLPVPDDPRIFGKMREIRMTFKP